jgi:vacuolar-type H+-ATPase subunit E/Vma4
MNDKPPTSPITVAADAVAAAKKAHEQHGAAVRSITREFLLQRQKAIQQELQAAVLRVNDAQKYLTRMEGCLADVNDLLKHLDETPLPEPKK